MLPSGRDLLRLAEGTGIVAASLEKVIRLAELLAGIGDQDDLKASLALKGGTALNLFFGPPSRLSVDLDFNFVGAEDLEPMLVTRPRVEHQLQALARSQGYTLQLSADAHASRKLFLSYSRLVDGQADRVEIDVNFLHRVCLLPTQELKMWRPDGDGPVATLLSWAEIAAGKIVALLDRAAPRDAWDVVRLPAVAPSSWPGEELRKTFVALAGSLPRPLHEYSIPPQHLRLPRESLSACRRLWKVLSANGDGRSHKSLASWRNLIAA